MKIFNDFKIFLERVNCVRVIIDNHKKMFYNNVNSIKTTENFIFELLSIMVSLFLLVITINYYFKFKILLDFKNNYNSLISELINIESIFIGLFSGTIFALITIEKKSFSKNGVIVLNELINSLLYFILLNILTIIYSLLFKIINNTIIIFIILFFLYYYLIQQCLLIFIFLKRITFLLNDKE